MAGQVMPQEARAFERRLAKGAPIEQEALGLGEATGQHDHERERLVGDRFCVFARCDNDRNLPGGRGGYVDVDRPAPGAANEPQPRRGG